MAKAFAAAKINLILHVTGQRSDGYHLLDSYVAMVDIGDRITVLPAEGLSLDCTGPFSPDIPLGPENLVMQAAHLFNNSKGAQIQLEKNLPASSGIGGGSSDAAAASGSKDKIVRALRLLLDNDAHSHSSRARP